MASYPLLFWYAIADTITGWGRNLNKLPANMGHDETQALSVSSVLPWVEE